MSDYDTYSKLWWRQKQWRWRFQGKLGTLRLCESHMQRLRLMFPKDQTVTTLADSIEADLEELRLALLAHANDWKDLTDADV